MSDTYIGWDGKQYPWPPPDGWYEAIDGRYWAPGTGPNPPPQGAGTAPEPTADPPAATDPGATTVAGGATSGGAAASGAPVVGGAGTPVDAGMTSQLPVQDPTRATIQQPYGSGPQPTPDTFNYGTAGGPEGAPGVGPVGEPEKSGGGILQAILIVFGMVAVAILGGLAYFYLTNGSGETTATDDTTAVDTGDETTDPTDPVAEAPDESTESTPAPDETPEEPAPDEGTGDTTPDGSDGEPVEPEEPEDPEDQTTTTAAATPELGEFRQILSDNNLTSENLTDDAITNFAQDFCAMAADAPDAAAFDETREASVAATNVNLTDDELRLVINAAIVSFCPDQAERLNVQP